MVRSRFGKLVRGGAERVCEGSGGPLGARGESRGSGLRSGQSSAYAGSRPRLLALAALAGAARIHSFPAGGLLVLPPFSHRPNPRPETLGHSSAQGPAPPPFHYGWGRLRRQLTIDLDHPACRREGNLIGLPASLEAPATIFGGLAHCWVLGGAGAGAASKPRAKSGENQWGQGANCSGRGGTRSRF